MSGCQKCCSNRNGYKGFSHKLPPQPTNPCDEVYLNCIGTPATLGMGCYWKAQAKIDSLAGVLRSRVGISGERNSKKGKDSDKLSGPCEVVDFEYDEDIVTFTQILEMFFRLHNPFMPSPRETCQSVIFYHSKEQKEEAESIIQTLHSEKYGCLMKTTILTKIIPAEKVVISKREDQHYELQMQDPRLLESIGFYEMSPEQIVYSHLLCRLNGYLAHKKYTCQQFEEEKIELHLSDDQEALVRRMLAHLCRGDSTDTHPGDTLLEEESSFMFGGD